MSEKARRRSLSSPRVVIAGLRGSGGKTLVTVGLAAAWRKQNLLVAPFKKGADYIDSAWLSSATGHPCRNLDLFMVPKETVARSFAGGARGMDLSLIEGNRGLYDGMDVRGSYSTAELAKLLRAPVVLVCDSTKTTRTLAAMVLGCQRLDPEVDIKGVILNRVAGARHEKLLREVIADYCALPVLGAVPRQSEDPFPERHLGLVPPQERERVPDTVEAAAEIASRHIDLAGLREVAEAALPLPMESNGGGGHGVEKAAERAVIGVFRDEAFQFYYPENLEALKSTGGRVVECSPLRDEHLPRVDAIYVGGGFPEMFAARLAANTSFRSEVANAVERGMPVYAECAGAVYLGEGLVMGENRFPMAGALPVLFGFGARPQGHGYAVVEVTGENAFFESGTTLRGHEFHYTRVLNLDEKRVSLAFRVKRGYGIDGERDGLCRKNTLASYCHIHALGVEGWARSLVEAAAATRSR